MPGAAPSQAKDRPKGNGKKGESKGESQKGESLKGGSFAGKKRAWHGILDSFRGISV